ncbi:MAG: dTDP-4-dehydrorhamnose reductase [Bacteroidetes bacterium]|nr:dTDP-4-dehydrorhamnose reductase [Bacteroidota bacterium]
MSKPKIIVTGANGQLGKELQVASSSFPQFEFIFLSKEELPIENADVVKKIFSDKQPLFCINCAAYTAVDKAESEKEKAFLINAEAVGILGKACASVNAKFIHISTDYVFDGSSSTPLKETDSTNPVNIYGESKLLGEMKAFEYCKETMVIRTSWVYSEFGNNFVKTMIRLMKERESLNVINDQTGSPTYAADLAKAILEIIAGKKFTPGIYNYSNEGEITWYQFAIAIKELTASPCVVHPISTSQYPTPAKRPQYSLLDKAKIKEIYDINIPQWKASLVACISRLNTK